MSGARDHRPSIESYGLAAVVAALMLTGLGLVLVYSASGVRSAERVRPGDAEFYLRQQLTWTLVAVIGMIACARIDFRRWGRGGRTLLLIAAALLVAVLFVGTAWNNSRRWIRFAGFGFQPSELAKVAVIVFVAAEVCRLGPRIRSYFGFLSIFVPLGVICALVFVEPDFGTTLFIAAIGLAMMFAGGTRPAHIGVTMAPLGAALGVAVLTMGSMRHVLSRFDFFFGGDVHPQVKQSLIAIGSGGVFGRGLGAGAAKLGFVPESASDFIFAVVGEELGLVGSLLVLALYAGFVWCGLRVCLASLRVSRFGFFLSLGIVFMIGFQALFNIAVVTGVAPPKGIALPFLSAGGTSAVVLLSAVGILYNVAVTCERERRSEVLDPVEAPTW